MTKETAHTLIAFTMPKWGIEMAEGTIGEWMVEEGASVSKGETVAAIETDKISNEVDAEWNASLLRRLAGPGETLPVGALMAVFGPADTPGAVVDAFIADFKPADTAYEPTDSDEEDIPPEDSAVSSPPPVREVEESTPKYRVPEDLAISAKARALAEKEAIDLDDLEGSGRRGRITLQDVEQLSRSPRPLKKVGPLPLPDDEDGVPATPLARREAALLEVDLAAIAGTGKAGRVRRADVLAKTPQKAGNAPEIIPHSGMRRAIAKRLVEAVNTVPHFYLRTEIDVDWLTSLREKLNRERGWKLSVNDFLLKAVANVLIAVPNCNVHVFDGEIHRFPHADLSVAVAIDGGLITPIVRAADTKSILEISNEAKDLVARAREGKLMPEDYQGGTFSVSNLGMYGLESFDAIINPPQGAILAVGAARRQPVERNFSLSFVSRLQVTLSCDHRAIDGALGATFLKELKNELEHPAGLVGGL